MEYLRAHHRLERSGGSAHRDRLRTCTGRLMRIATPLSLVAAFAVYAAGAPLLAQQKTPPAPASAAKKGNATIAGVVVDSLNGRYLSGADVVVQGAKASLVTDSLGNFRIDSLPPGTYQVGVFHPMLDTLGISLASAPFRVGTDSVSVILLA